MKKPPPYLNPNKFDFKPLFCCHAEESINLIYNILKEKIKALLLKKGGEKSLKRSFRDFGGGCNF